MVSAVEPERLNCGLITFETTVRSTVVAAGAEAGIICLAATTASLKIMNPVVISEPEVPSARQRVMNCRCQDRLVWFGVSANVGDEAMMVPLAAPPLPQ